MKTIIGIGSAGCNIAELFEKDPSVHVRLIDTGIEGENCYEFPYQETVEDYEKNCPDLTSFFSNVSHDVLFILAGSGKISGATLSILKQIKDKKIRVLYIQPDVDLLSSNAKAQNRLTFNVLQEYARSGVFERIYLVNNSEVEKIAGDVSILEYNNKINNIIFDIFSNLEIFNNTEGIINNITDPKDINRIATIGVYYVDSNKESLLYPLTFIDEKYFYFAINEDDLKNNTKLLRTIKENMKLMSTNGTKVSYKIVNTTHEQSFCFVVAYSKKVQE